jgi:hypothetical protein
MAIGKRTTKPKQVRKLVVEFFEPKLLDQFEKKAKAENSDRCKMTRILIKKYLEGGLSA